MSEWQDIATAPRDERVLVWTDTDNPDDRWYIRDVCEGEHVRCVQVGILGSGDEEWDLALIGQPTHWMPLPDAPAVRSCGDYEPNIEGRS